MKWAELLRDRRGVVFAVPAGALALLVVVAAFNMDRGGSKERAPSRLAEAEELLAPRQASAEELARASSGIADQTAVSLESGAWIQVADGNGRLAQQYSATRLEPLAGSQLAMTEPRAMVYLRDGRVLVLSARKGVTYVPRRALESGTLEEDVVVRLYRPDGGRAVDLERDAPAVVVTADEARFDGVLGEVRCDRAVRVATDVGSFAGEGLSLFLDGEGDGVERLVVERALEPIRIDRAARAMAARRGSAGGVDGAPVAAAGGGGDAGAGAEPGGAASTTGRTRREPRFHRLVLDGGVEIVRVRDGVLSIIRGDELHAVFSLDGEGMDEVAFVPGAGSPLAGAGAGAAQSARAIVPLLHAQSAAVASTDAGVPPTAGAEGDVVTVAFGGRLVMLPIVDPAERPKSKDDIRFDVLGERVEVIDGRSASRIVGTRLRYGVLDESIEVEGSDRRPMSVVNARMSLEGGRFRASLRSGEGRLEGPGRIAFSRGAARSVSMLEVVPLLPPSLARALVSADPEALVSPMIPSPVGDDPPPIRFDPAAQQLEITWEGGVDLRFAGEEDDARLSSARFEKAVRVEGRQFELGSAVLEVAFAPGGRDRIETIIADGGTVVRRLGAEGGLRAERLELSLAEGSAGDALPRKLVARRAIEARDERQTVWTEDLVVTFRERAPAAGGDGGRGGGDRPSRTARDAERRDGNRGEGDLAEADLGAIEVDTVLAKGGVEVLLKEGARVFAETLEGDAARRRLRLTGEDVAIVRTNVVADTLRDIRFDEAARSARSEGPGRFRVFRDPVVASEGRAARPEPVARPTMEATWTGSLEYGEIVESRGVVDIRGDVRMRSRPSPRTSDAVDADAVLLELGVAPGTRTADAPAAARTLDHFIAKGGARLESRTWEDDARTGDPRVFRVAGEHVEYDLGTREGLVVGDGTILVNMPAAAGAPPVERAKGSLALGADGTTRFRWKRRMALERLYDDVFRIVMETGVELLHAGLRADDTLSMRCDRLEATVRRPQAAPDEKRSSEARSSEGGAAPASEPADERGADLGGPAELRGIRATGAVFIRTPEQDIECGDFEYSVETGLATLKATEGRTVTIAVRGQPTPIRAEEVRWDLRNGRLQVTRMAGSGGR